MSDRLEDYFGLCPICKKTDGFINVGRSHWFYCREHKKKWCAGANLFSGWRDQTEDQQRKIYDDLEFGSYENIEPLRSHTPADSVDEHLNWVTERMEDAIADYIVLSQAWDHCELHHGDPNNFENVKREINESIARVIEQIRCQRFEREQEPLPF